MEIIDRYSRQDAINDGVLVDVSDTKEAQEAGFKIPVYLTTGVYQLVKVPEGFEGFQDYTGRLWDTLYMATFEFKMAKRQGKTEEDMKILPFQVSYLMPAKTKEYKLIAYRLWLVFSSHEGFTIMLPEEY